MRLLLRPTWLTRRTPVSRLLRATPHSAVHHTSTTNAAPVDIPKILVKPGSPYHNSLASYLEYATRRNLSPDRTVYIGTHFEYTSAEALLRLGFSLIRTGQKNDAGIDLIGHWMLSFFREPIPVIVQCKSRMKTLSPNEIREMEGAFRSVPHEWHRKDVLGMLISTQKATEGLRKQMHLSTRPVAFLQISRTGIITQFLWNRAAAERGLEGVGVTPRYTVLPPETNELGVETKIYRCEDRPRDAQGRFIKDPYSSLRRKGGPRTVVTDIQLTWLGTPVFPNREVLSLETARRISANVKAHEIAQKELKEQTKRKIGRPLGSKNGCKAARAAANKKQGRQLGLKTKQKIATIAANEPEMRRKRGRPPGIKKKHVFDQEGCGEILVKPVVPARRGRPPASVKRELTQKSTKVDVSENALVEVVAPKKRGRPLGRRIKPVVPDGG